MSVSNCQTMTRKFPQKEDLNYTAAKSCDVANCPLVRSIQSVNSIKPIGHYMYRTVVTIFTASLTEKSSKVSPHSVFMSYV